MTNKIEIEKVEIEVETEEEAKSIMQRVDACESPEAVQAMIEILKAEQANKPRDRGFEFIPRKHQAKAEKIMRDEFMKDGVWRTQRLMMSLTGGVAKTLGDMMEHKQELRKLFSAELLEDLHALSLINSVAIKYIKGKDAHVKAQKTKGE